MGRIYTPVSLFWIQRHVKNTAVPYFNVPLTLNELCTLFYISFVCSPLSVSRQGLGGKWRPDLPSILLLLLLSCKWLRGTAVKRVSKNYFTHLSTFCFAYLGTYLLTYLLFQTLEGERVRAVKDRCLSTQTRDLHTR